MNEANEEYFKAQPVATGDGPSENHAGFLGTFGIKDEKELDLLTKLIFAKKDGDPYYRSPLQSDEEKQRGVDHADNRS